MAYAEACFETFRVVNGAIFSWPQHMARLRHGLAEFGLSLSDSGVKEIYAASLDAAADIGGDALVRVTVAGGKGAWGLLTHAAKPTIYIQSMPARETFDPLIMRLRSWPFPPRLRPAKFSSDYSDSLRALKGEPDVNVLFAHGGLMLGAATANLLLYRQGRWWTPKLGPGILPGIIRGHLLATGLLSEASCPLAWLPECEAVGICNSGVFVLPVAQVDGHEAGMLEFDVKHTAFHQLTGIFEGLEGVPGVLLR